MALVSRWFLGLVVIDFLLAIAVIYNTHGTRMLQIKMEGLSKHEDYLHQSQMQLLIEKGAWSNLSDVQRVAEEKLGMTLPKLSEIVFIGQQ